MPLARPLQASFSGGEVSPSLYGRTDIDKYKSSAKTVRNFILHSQGGASNRQGSQLISTAKNSNKICIVQEFVFSRTVTYVLEIGEQYIRFYTGGSQIMVDGAAYEIATPYLEDDLYDLRFESSGDIIWIMHPDYQTRTLTRYSNASWALSTYAPNDGPFRPENTNESASLAVSAVTGDGVTLTLSAVLDSYTNTLMHFDSMDTSITEETGKTVTVVGSAISSSNASKFGGASLHLPQNIYDANTKLLLHLDNNVTDSSASPKTVTNNSVLFSSSTKNLGSHSAYFNGTSAYLSIPDSADFSTGSGDFTIAMFVNLSSIAAMDLISQYENSSTYWRLTWNGGSALQFTFEDSGNIVQVTGSWSPSVSTWYHISLVRSGNDYTMRVNGVTVGTATDTDSLSDVTAAVNIGRLGPGGTPTNYFNGYMDEIIFVKGTALWTSDFTPPTDPYSSGDYISLPDSDDYYFGTGPFTIECCAYFEDLTGVQIIAGQYADASNYWFIKKDASHKLQIKFVSAGSTKCDYITTSAVSFSVDTQYQILFARNTTNVYIMVDGSPESLTANTAVSTNDVGNVSAALVIGQQNSTSYFYGYIDEFRISKGIARHTSSYTPDTSAFSLLDSGTDAFLFNPLHVGALFKLRHYVPGATVSTAFSSATTSTSIKCFTTWRLISHGTWTGKFRIEKSIDGGTTWTELRTFTSSNDFNANTSGTEDIETNLVPFLIRINMYSYSSGTANIDLSSDPYYQDGIVRAATYQSSTSMLVNVLQDVASTDETTSWAEGSWSDYRGYPRDAKFFSDRLCFVSNDSEPINIWTTQTGVYDSFRRNTPLLDTDAITLRLPTRQLNAINGIVAFKRLLVFTSASVWSVGSIDTTAFTPSTAIAETEEYETGSGGVAQIAIGQESLYCGADNETIRNMAFQIAGNGYTGADINILAKHLFEGYTVLKMGYQKSPNSTVWVLRNDGILLNMAYLKEQQVLGWGHCDTDGEIKSICVVPNAGNDELWMTVQRDNGIYIERMKGRRQFSISDHVFLDSYVEFTSPTTVLSGLDHLAGIVPGVIADGSDQSNTVAVSSTGTLAVSSGFSVVDVGLPITSDLELLDIDIPSQYGSMQGVDIRVGNVNFRLINTRGGYIGPDSNNLYECFTYARLNEAYKREKRTALGSKTNFNGIVRAPIGGATETAGRVFYRQTQPYPVTISAIIPEITGPTPGK